MIAVFIINRLRNVLGKKTGNESDIVEKFTQKKTTYKESDPDTVTNTKRKSKDQFKSQTLHSDKKINNSINQILKIDPNFEIHAFSDGAKKAFEFILKEYSNNNLNQLGKLVSKKMYVAFESQIKDREKAEEDLEITVISVNDPKIENIKIEKKNIAFVKLGFNSEQVQVVKDKNGQVIDGDNNQILAIKESWTFSKNLKSEDPNWILEEIEESS